MKKFVAIVLTIVMVLGMSSMAFANPAPKTVVGELEVLNSSTIYVGDVVNLRARILKHGSRFIEEIDNIELYEDGYYVINYTVTAGPAGLQEETYRMTMRAGNGKSEVVFNGIATTSFTVIERPPVTVPQIVSYEITNWTKGNAIYNSNGTNIIGYEANGKLWAVYDNGNKVIINEDFDFQLTQNNDNLKKPETYNNLPVALN